MRYLSGMTGTFGTCDSEEASFLCHVLFLGKPRKPGGDDLGSRGIRGVLLLRHK
jgi:hypothetical protein